MQSVLKKVLKKSDGTIDENLIQEILTREETNKVSHIYFTRENKDISSLNGIENLPYYIRGLIIDKPIKEIGEAKVLPYHLYHLKINCELLKTPELQKLLVLIKNTLICNVQILSNLPLEKQEDFILATSNNKDNIEKISLYINNNLYKFSDDKILYNEFSFINYNSFKMA